jgi:hypothetical protein
MPQEELCFFSYLGGCNAAAAARVTRFGAACSGGGTALSSSRTWSLSLEREEEEKSVR